MASARRWAAAVAEHETSVAAFRAAVRGIPAAGWTAAAAGKWSPAEEALHVVATYELGTTIAAGDVVMRPRVPRAVAALSRWLLLPWLLRTGGFPRGADAPREVRPDRAVAHALDAAALLARLDRVADAAMRALRAADARRPRPRIVHAYFGPLPPLGALRLVSAHTRHHARALARRGAGAARAISRPASASRRAPP